VLCPHPAVRSGRPDQEFMRLKMALQVVQ